MLEDLTLKGLFSITGFSVSPICTTHGMYLASLVGPPCLPQSACLGRSYSLFVSVFRAQLKTPMVVLGCR